MRQIGTLKLADEAQRFAAYLVTQGISAEAEPAGDDFAIWVKNEDQVPSAKEALAHFVQSPNDARYQGAESRAAAMEQASRKEREKARGKVVDIRGRWQRNTAGGFRSAPLTFVLIALSVVIYLSGATLNDGSRATNDSGANALYFLGPVKVPGTRFLTVPQQANGTIDGFYSIRHGQVWRLVTPIFLHSGSNITHILFNMIILYSFGRRIEARYGAWRTGLLVLAIAVASNVGQYLWAGHPFFGGMSGVNFGLLGFLWVRSNYFPASSLYLDQGTFIFMMGFMFLCIAAEFSPDVAALQLFSNVANGAHVVGLVMGLLIGAAPLAWQRR